MAEVKRIVLLNSDQTTLGELSRQMMEYLSARAELHQGLQGIQVVFMKNGDYNHKNGDYSFDVGWVIEKYRRGGGLEF